MEFAAERLISVERGGLLDQKRARSRQRCAIPFFVGVGQRTVGGGLADAAAARLSKPSFRKNRLHMRTDRVTQQSKLGLDSINWTGITEC